MNSFNKRMQKQSQYFQLHMWRIHNKEKQKAYWWFYRKAYHRYFQVKLEDQDRSWAPYVVWMTCKEHIRQWTNETRKSLKFGIPMVWREPQNHSDDRYFCSIDTTGLNKKNHKSKNYPCLNSAIRSVPHSNEVLIPLFSGFSLKDTNKSDHNIIYDAATNEDVSLSDTEFIKRISRTLSVTAKEKKTCWKVVRE